MLPFSFLHRCLVMCVALLFVFGAEAKLDFRTKEVDFLILQAAFDGDVAEIKRLAAAGADLNVEGADDMRPIHLATMMRRTDAVLALMELGADIQASKCRRSVFGLAAERGQTQLCKALLAKGFKLRRPNGDVVGDLSDAILSGKPEIVKMLVLRGLKVDDLHSTDFSPMQLAVRSDSPDMVRYLISQSISATGGGWSFDFSAFLTACRESSTEVVHAMIEAGADPVKEETPDKGLFTSPVMQAAAGDRLEIVRLLLSYPVPQLQLDMGALIANRRRHAVLLKLFRNRGGDPARAQAWISENKAASAKPVRETEVRLNLPKARRAKPTEIRRTTAIVVSASRGSAALGDLLAARFSQNPQAKVFAGEEIRKILGELELEDGDPGKRLTALAGKLPPTDLMVDLSVQRKRDGELLELRALDVETGVLVFAEKLPWPLKNLQEWTNGLSDFLLQYYADRRKLASERTPVAVLDFRAQFASEASTRTEKRLAAEVVRQLTRIPSVFVAEREHLTLRDGVLTSVSGDVKRAGFLVQGSLALEESGLKAKISIRSVNGEKTVEVQGGDADQLASRIVLAIVAEAKNPEVNAPKDPQVESEAFLKEAYWFASQQLWNACLSAADASWILGRQTCEVALLRTKARVEVLKEMHGELLNRGGVSGSADWFSGTLQPNWWYVDFEPKEVLLLANAVLTNLREALDPRRSTRKLLRPACRSSRSCGRF